MNSKNLLNISDLTRENIDQILDYAFRLRENNSDDLKNKNIGGGSVISLEEDGNVALQLIFNDKGTVDRN